MTSAIAAGLLALGVGTGYNLLLRYAVERFVSAPISTIPIIASTLLARLLVVLGILGVLLVWGALPAVCALSGYWVGRTAVVASSLSKGSA